MKKILFTLVLVLLLIGIIPAAARTYYYDMADTTLWLAVEESYNEGQKDKEKGDIRISRGMGIGWFKPGNAVEVLDTVDFGNGLVNVSAVVAAAYPEGYFAENAPDYAFEIRIDTYDGPVVAIIKPEGSGAWDVEVDARECIVTEVGKATKGEHKIFVVNMLGTPDDYINGTTLAGSNFNELTLETSAEEPTPSPTPETTEAPTPTQVPTATATKAPTVAPTQEADSEGSQQLVIYAVIGAVAIIAVIAIIIIVIKKKSK